MKALRSIVLICGSLLALGLAGCESEPMEVESRDIGAFEAVDLRGAAQMEIAVGQETSLKIEGSRYAVRHLRARVRDNTLIIDAKKSGWAWFGDDEELKLTITTSKLVSLKSSGAGNIAVSGLNGGDQRVVIAGAHKLEARGQLDKLTIELNGAGDIDYGGVTAQEAKVVVNGAGNVLVRPTELLSATVNGVGAIHYEGEPRKVESSIHGVGSIGRN